MFFSVQSDIFRWGLGALLGTIVSGGVSGGHLNPAVTVALASIGKFPWSKVCPFFHCLFGLTSLIPTVQVLHYMAAQYLGAFAASGVVFLVYWDALVW